MEGKDKRAHLRIIDKLQFIYNKVDTKEFDKLKKNITDGSTPFSPWSDDTLSYSSSNDAVLEKEWRLSLR